MALRFGIRVLDPAPTTFSSVKVEINLENTGPDACEIPGPGDSSDALTIAAYYPDGRLLRSMNGLTRQLMRSAGRVNGDYSLATIEPGQRWAWTIDLAKYHYTFLEGEFELEGSFAYPPLNLSLRSERQKVRVTAPSLRSLNLSHDNPVLGRIDMVFGVGSNDSPAFYLRQHSNLPLAAAYSEPLPIPPNGTAFCADANYFQTASFGPAAKRWLLWTDGAELHAWEVISGVPSGRERKAILPSGRVALRSAYYTEEDRLFVFLAAQQGQLECWEMTENSLDLDFAHTLAAGRARDAVVGVDADSIHILAPANGLMYERLATSGDPTGSRQLFRSRLEPRLWRFDTVERKAIALFWDGPHGRAVEMFSHDFGTGTRRALSLDSLGLRSPIREWSLATDRLNRFHLLVSTVRNRLYYFLEGHGPILVAAGEERFLPQVIAHRQVFLGCYRRNYGYRFLTLSNASFQPKFAQFEAEP